MKQEKQEGRTQKIDFVSLLSRFFFFRNIIKMWFYYITYFRDIDYIGHETHGQVDAPEFSRSNIEYIFNFFKVYGGKRREGEGGKKNRQREKEEGGRGRKEERKEEQARE